MLHELLKIEVSELILLADLEELSELSIRVNLSAIGLILKTMALNISIDLLAHLSTRHLSTNGLAKELGKLITDSGGLDEARRLTVAIVASLLRRELLSILHLTGNDLLKSLEIILDRREETNELLKLSIELGHLHRKTGDITGNLSRGRRDGCNWRNNLWCRCSLNLSGLLRGLSCRCRSSSIRNRGGGGKPFGRLLKI